jgi:hypothetical protein
MQFFLHCSGLSKHEMIAAPVKLSTRLRSRYRAFMFSFGPKRNRKFVPVRNDCLMPECNKIIEQGKGSMYRSQGKTTPPTVYCKGEK